MDAAETLESLAQALAGTWYHPEVVRLTSVLTALGVVVAPVAWAIRRYDAGRQVRVRVARRIHDEMGDTMKAVTGSGGRRIVEMTIPDPNSTGTNATCKKIRFAKAFFNHDAYDTFLQAGQLTSLRGSLLQEVQDVYQRIKRHNNYIDRLQQHNDRMSEATCLLDALSKRYRPRESGTSEELEAACPPDVANTYYEILGKYDSELREMLPDAMEKLKRSWSRWPRFGRPSRP